MAKSSVQYIVQKLKKLKLVANLPGRGRKRLTTPRQDNIIRTSRLENRRNTASAMAAELHRDLFLTVSPSSSETACMKLAIMAGWPRRSPGSFLRTRVPSPLIHNPSEQATDLLEQDPLVQKNQV
jgi:hypothetical protein